MSPIERFLDGKLVVDNPSETRAASLTVCRFATDAEDALELLRMLGLVDKPANTGMGSRASWQ